jgi:hypothetical protein
MDKTVLSKRLDAMELAARLNVEENPDDRWIVHEGYVTLPARRVIEAIGLARIGLEHAQ